MKVLKNLFIALLLIFTLSKAIAQLGLSNTLGYVPDSKAMLDINSTTKGILIPRMTTTQRIDIAPTATQIGLHVFDLTTKSQWSWDGAVWKEMASGFSLPYAGTSNSGTNSLDITNTVGRAAYFQSPNSSETMRVYNSGTGNAITVDGNLDIKGSLKANGLNGTAGQILTTTGSALAWANVTSPATTYAIGDYAQGGVVFWVSPNGQHGKVVNIYDAGYAYWSNITASVGNTAQSDKNGAGNSFAIINQVGHLQSVASLCTTLEFNNYFDWYCPAIDELVQLYTNKTAVETTVLANGGESFASTYWSSTETSPVTGTGIAKLINFLNGSISIAIGKNVSLEYVRAIRSF